MPRASLETFPLAWERLLWSARPGAVRRLLQPAVRYVLTDFRLVVRRRRRTVTELALDDIVNVELEQAALQRVLGTSTVRIHSKLGAEPLVLHDIDHGPQLALILQLLAADGHLTPLDEDFVRSALGPGAAPLVGPKRGLIAAATAVCVFAFGIGSLARHKTIAPVTYAAEDPIAPAGQRRPTAEIVAFMRREVMPFATRALAPVVGGASNVTCHTCHGEDAETRGWKMPGVRALPEPELRLAGMERFGFWLDPQVRNAVYGYLAEEEKLPTAAYMRRVVMPGMAGLLHRPAYDFTRSYGYNREHAAVGCYHCHLVDSRD